MSHIRPQCPCELGLVLEGEDARRFNEYMENPTCTPDGIKLINAAMEFNRACRKVAWCLACHHRYDDNHDGFINTSKCKICGQDAVVWGSPGAQTYYFKMEDDECDTN